jgi:hypothetical protein
VCAILWSAQCPRRRHMCLRAALDALHPAAVCGERIDHRSLLPNAVSGGVLMRRPSLGERRSHSVT